MQNMENEVFVESNKSQQNIFNMHFDLERDFLLQSHKKTVTILNNSNHKGWGFENEVRSSISRNIAQSIHVGTGEIISHKTGMMKKGKQIDVVIQNPNFPRLPISGNIDSFLYETVLSFGEIKGKLYKKHISEFAETVSEIQSSTNLLQTRNVITTTENVAKAKVRPISFMLAAETSATSIIQVCDWMKEINLSDKRYNVNMMKNMENKDKNYFNHKFIDGVYILNLGYVVSASLPFQESNNLDKIDKEHLWIFSECNPLGFFCAILQRIYYDNFYTIFDAGEYLGKGHRTYTANHLNVSNK